MTRADGKKICDKEIGHWRRGWHSCKRGAVVSIPSTRTVGMTLDYCVRHQPKIAKNYGKQSLPIVGRDVLPLSERSERT